MIEGVSLSPSPSLTALAAAALHVDRSPERILEIGCGEGDGVLFLAREFPGARVRGVDSDMATVHAASSRVGLDPEGRVAFKRGSRRSLPYPNDFFDLVVQRHGAILPMEISRVLRSGGNLIYVIGQPKWWWLPKGKPDRPPRLLRRMGFEAIEKGEAAGEVFYVGRLDGD
ncbi:MAG TPA: methyltransferase domain-containing protein [Solirubrobacterales bacterium]|jgi:ubiquinone/menaquinone biosynthesis C-methylase UbiE